MEGTKLYELSAYNFRGNMVFYQQIITLKSIFSWRNKSGKVLSFRFIGVQNDKIEK